MTAARILLVLSITATLTLQPSPADAQLEAFVREVRGLADAAGQPEPAASKNTRSAADRMAAALAEWDRNIDALSARVGRESAAAPTDGTYRLHVELGVAYRVRGRVTDALREFDTAAALRPSSSDVQVLRALTLEAAGRTQEAGRAFLDAWRLDTGDPVKAYYVTQRVNGDNAAERARALAVLTDAYQHLSLDAARPPAAPFVTLSAIPDSLSRTPVVAGSGAAAGFALLSANKYDEAVVVLRQAGDRQAEHAEDSPLLHFARGQRDEAQNHLADARREYVAALAGTLAGRQVLLVGMARLAQVEGDATAAIDALTQAVRLNPNDPGIHKEFAGVYTAQGRADAAFSELMAALVIDRRDAEAHATIGQLYLDTGRNAEAVTAFTRTLELAPGHYETRYGLAMAHTRLGHTEEAARQLDLFERARQEAEARRRREIANER